MTAVALDTRSAEAIRRELSCGRSGCSCARSTNTHCPVAVHGRGRGDANPSLGIDVGGDGTPLVHCHGGCSQAEVLDELKARGLWPASRQVRRSGERAAAERSEHVGPWREAKAWAAFDVEGVERGDHARLDCHDALCEAEIAAGGKRAKQFKWRQPDGAPGLGGFPVAQLALYGAFELTDKDNSITVVVEGERARDALERLGISAVGTITGASGTPSDDSLRCLLGRTVILWPDADQFGRLHMQRIAERLRALGHRDLRILEWTGAPAGGDAADCDPDQARALLDSTERWSPEPGVQATRTRWSAADLLAAQFAELRCLIDRIVPSEGVVLLVGAPKLGKSWMALGLAIAVASGGKALGSLAVDQAGPVLCVALEDSPRRLASRLTSVLAGGRAPEGLELWTEMPRLDEGGVDQIRAWLDANPEARMVIIDTFARARPKRSRNGSAYDEDYSAIAEIQSLAMQYGVAIVLLHHDRKAAATDWVETVNGSTGLTAAADALLLLRRERGEHDAALLVTGRDLDEAEIALKFDAQIGTWSTLGDAQQYRLSPERRAVLEAIEEAGKALGPQEIAAATGHDYDATRRLLSRMVEDGDLNSPGRGLYVSPVTSVTTSQADPLLTPNVTNGIDVTGGVEGEFDEAGAVEDSEPPAARVRKETRL